MSDEMLTLDEALDVIRNAPNRFIAGSIRNDVAMQAMHHRRPTLDATKCTAAFYERWGNELIDAARQVPRGDAPVSGNWGD